MADPTDLAGRLRDLDALLDGIAHRLAEASERAGTRVTVRPSRLYSLVLRHWPRVAVALVGLGVAVDLVIGGMAADSAFEFYLMAWGTTTAGLWFLFDKAETAVSPSVRAKMTAWFREADLRELIEGIPSHFAALFDRVFGERHLTVRCLFRSSVASMLSAFVMLGIMAALHPQLLLSMPLQAARELAAFEGGPWTGSRAFQILPEAYRVLGGAPELVTMPAVFALWLAQAAGLAIVLNIVPDYLSLLETRWLLKTKQRIVPFPALLLLDAALTSTLSLIWVLQVLGPGGPTNLSDLVGDLVLGGSIIGEDGVRSQNAVMHAGYPFPLGMFFWSAFFTSVWLWLYAAAVPVSRLLVRMNSGAGFLLRATDVERQPLRSLGFVGVLLVSLLFALGLPLLLL